MHLLKTGDCRLIDFWNNIPLFFAIHFTILVEKSAGVPRRNTKWYLPINSIGTACLAITVDIRDATEWAHQ
eukprot:6581329-Karenia_brevis.AAC.1